MKIGFIGTGIMGRHMAGHLQAAGHQLYLTRHRSTIPGGLIKGGAVVCANSRDAARQSDLIITMLPDTPDVEQVLFGPDGVAEALTPGKIVLDMSSIDPIETREFGRKIRDLECHFADAPVSGGEIGAKAASLTIMVGADAETFGRIEPLLRIIGKNVTLIGDVGDGQVAKVANQIIVALNIAAAAEALVFAAKAGADPTRVREALMGGFAASRVLEVHAEKMIHRKFEPGFRIRLHQKDLGIALSGAQRLGVALPGTALAQQLFSTCVAQGGSEWDHSAIVKALEISAGHALAQDRKTP